MTNFEYGFLKGDMTMWPRWGAALGVVMEFCKNFGWGGFGEPTPAGLRAMEEYELRRSTIDYENV